MLLGVLLAGGLSSRMGKDKALLSFAGETQLQRGRKKLLAAGCDQILVSRNQPGFIMDKFVQCGPLSGVHACLTEQDCKEALILPVDMPLLPTKSLQRLITVGRYQQKNCYFVHSVLPCYLVNPSEALFVLSQQLANNELAVNHWLSELGSYSINADFGLKNIELSFLNTNTPEQWKQAQLLIGQVDNA